MDVLMLNGSPRKNGNTEVLLNAIADGVRDNGGQVENIRLAGLKISPCKACGGCDKTGICIQPDDMVPLYDKVSRAERIIIGSPIYFYGVTAQTKLFIDRTQALWCRKYLLTPNEQEEDDSGRKGFFVSVAATMGKKTFNGAKLTVKYCFDAIGVKDCGDLLVRGIDKRGEMAEALGEIGRAKEFGRQLLK
jgi:multimeric flavodoxin WrbA